MTLKATRPILFRSLQFRKGDTLPADNEAMVKAWLDAGSAIWDDETDDGSEGGKTGAEAKKPAKKPANRRTKK